VQAVMLLGVAARWVQQFSTSLVSLLDGSYRFCRSGVLGYTLSWGLVCCRMHMHSILPGVVGYITTQA
jgi:hypothetical protein